MRTEYSELEKIIIPVVENMGYEFIGSEKVSDGHRSILRIYIDEENGISLDTCAAVSEQISAVLDVESPIKSSYILEVSSPGLNRKLFSVEQLEKQVGKQVKLKLYAAIDGRKNFNGILKAVDGRSCTLDIDGTEVVFYLDDIDEARLVPEF